jgi:hypothetical protein
MSGMLGWFSCEHCSIFIQMHGIGIKFKVGLDKILIAHINCSYIFLG